MKRTEEQKARRREKDRADRADPGNVWIISWRANQLKHNASLSELEAIVRALKTRLFRANSHAWFVRKAH